MTAITQLSAVTIPLIGDELLTFVDTSAPTGQKNKKGTLSSVKDYVLSGVTSGSSIITSSVTINVPADYPDLKDAIDAYLDKYCAAGAVVNCVITSGHTVTQQCWYQDVDMPWFMIHGENGVVEVDATGWTANPLTGETALLSFISSRGPDIRCLFNNNGNNTDVTVFDLIGSTIECLGTANAVGATGGWNKIGEIQLQSALSALTWQSDGGNLVAKSDSDVNLQMYGGSQIVLSDIECWSGSKISLQDNSSGAPSIVLNAVSCRGGEVLVSDVEPTDSGGAGTVFEASEGGVIRITGSINHGSEVMIDTMFAVSEGSVIQCKEIGAGWAGNYNTWASPSLNTVSSDGLIMAPAAP